MQRIIWLVGILLLAAAPLWAQIGPARHLLTVRDLVGKPLPDVAVMIGDTVAARTDQNGYVEVVNPCTGTMPNLNYTLSQPGYRFRGMGPIGGVLGVINCYGGFQYAIDVRGTNLPQVAAVSAANFKAGLAPGMLVSIFGENLAVANASATTLPLSTTLAGRRVKVVDFSGGLLREGFAQLLFVSPTQINCLLPPELNTYGWITVTSEDNELGTGFFDGPLSQIAPGLFAANGNGRGVAAGVVLRVFAAGSQRYEPLVRYDAELKRLVPMPIDLGHETERVFLVLFGTGVRYRKPIDTPAASVGGTEVTVTYSGAQGHMPGLDQINLLLPRNLQGRNEVEVVVRYGSFTTNSVSVVIK